jgi:hypothetical protein
MIHFRFKRFYSRFKMVSFTYATALPAFGPVVGDLGGQPPHRVRMLPRSPDLGPRLAQGGVLSRRAPTDR